MNSFQKWAINHAQAHGFTVTLRGNWVELHKDGETHECMSVRGVESACAGMFVVELFSADSDSPKDCIPDYFATRDAAEKAGRDWIKTRKTDWAKRFSVKPAPMR